MRRPRRQSGFALLLVFALMAAAAVVMYTQLPRFVMEAQRNKEQLLIDRGEQYQRAIQLYYRKVKSWPKSIDDLEKGNSTRFLRRRYLDPFTGKADWRLVHMTNGVYTDSLVYNNDPNKEKKDKAQTFVAEIPSIGTDGADGDGPENVNQALQARASDRTKDPLDELPEALRAFVYRGSIAPAGSRPVHNAEDDVQYANGQRAPTPGVYGAGGVDLSGLSAQQILAVGASSNVGANETGGTSPVPGVGGVSFEEIQRRAAEAAASGTQPPTIGGGGGGFIGQAPGANTPYTPAVTPGAAGLSYTSIAGNDPNYPSPAVPGTLGFPTGINPPAPSFGSAQPAPSGGGGFIGGAPTGPTSAFGGFGQTPAGPGFGSPGAGGPPPGFGAPGVTGPSGQGAAALNNLLFNPQQPQGGAAAGQVAGGTGLVGVASKYKGQTVKVYREKSRFQFWEFIYDPAKDKSGKAAGGQTPGQNAPLPGGLPGGTATGSNLPGAPGQQTQPTPSGTRLPSSNQNGGFGIGGAGFGATSGASTSSSGSNSFIGGTVPTAPAVTPLPAPGGTTSPNGQPLPNTPAIPQPKPPTTGGGGFIGTN